MLIPILLLGGAGYWLWKKHKEDAGSVNRVEPAVPPIPSSPSKPLVGGGGMHAVTPTVVLNGKSLTLPNGGAWIVDGPSQTELAIVGISSSDGDTRDLKDVTAALWMLGANFSPKNPPYIITSFVTPLQAFQNLTKK